MYEFMCWSLGDCPVTWRRPVAWLAPQTYINNNNTTNNTNDNTTTNNNDDNNNNRSLIQWAGCRSKSPALCHPKP